MRVLPAGPGREQSQGEEIANSISHGIALKAFDKASHPVLSTGLYLLMGWLVVVAFDPLAASLPAAGLLWLVAGGMSYTIGLAFFAIGSRLQYGHLVWHLFVMAGTACHYFAVLWYAI